MNECHEETEVSKILKDILLFRPTYLMAIFTTILFLLAFSTISLAASETALGSSNYTFGAIGVSTTYENKTDEPVSAQTEGRWCGQVCASIYCPYGNKVDANGCYTCECAEKPQGMIEPTSVALSTLPVVLKASDSIQLTITFDKFPSHPTFYTLSLQYKQSSQTDSRYIRIKYFKLADLTRIDNSVTINFIPKDSNINLPDNYDIKVYFDGAETHLTSNQVSFTLIDTISPIISSVSASEITTSSVKITWSTNEPADSQVEYGESTSYRFQTTLSSELVISHSQTISGLSSGTTYHYRVKSKDASSNLATSGDYTFTTSTIVFCTQDMFRCPDGSYVGRDYDNNCQFKPCPIITNKTTQTETSSEITIKSEIKEITSSPSEQPTDIQKSIPAQIGGSWAGAGGVSSARYIDVTTGSVNTSTGLLSNASSATVAVMKVIEKLHEINIEAEVKTESGTKLITIEKSGDNLRISSNNVNAATSEPIKLRDNGIFLKNEDSKSEIKIFPDTAQEIANSVGINSVTNIKLKSEEDTPIYNIQGYSEKKLFWFIPVKVDYTITLDANQGSIQEIVKPWWDIFAI